MENSFENESHLYVIKGNKDEKRLMHLKNDNNIEIMTGNNTDGIINKLFSWLLHRNQIGSEESMKGSEFVFYYVHWLLYKGNQINLNCNGSYKVTWIAGFL